jgi:RNA polymerase sigma-70 factor (ECF subfamily)
MSFADEAARLARAREWDSRALGQIHDQYYQEIYRYALYRTGESTAAEDIASEVFLRLLNALHARRAPQTTLRGWLFGVAAHLVADHFRRAPRESVPLTWTIADPAPSPAAEVEANIRQQQVRAAIRRLTSEQQEVLALRFGSGFSVAETAQALGKSEAAVKALQFRALESLRQRLVEVE